MGMSADADMTDSGGTGLLACFDGDRIEVLGIIKCIEDAFDLDSLVVVGPMRTVSGIEGLVREEEGDGIEARRFTPVVLSGENREGVLDRQRTNIEQAAEPANRDRVKNQGGWHFVPVRIALWDHGCSAFAPHPTASYGWQLRRS